MKKRKIYMKQDATGRYYFTWEKNDFGGYYNAEEMLKKKGLTTKDVEVEQVLNVMYLDD